MVTTVDTLPFGETIALRDAPGPRGTLLLGVAREVRADPLRYFVDAMRTYGDAVRLRVGLDRIVMLNHPDAVRHVLQDNHRNYRKSKFYRPLRPLLGRGIFVSEGDEWLKQRRTATPAFAGGRFDEMARCIAAAAARRMKRWPVSRNFAEPFDIAPEMMRVTFEGVASALFDIRMDEAGYSAFHDAVTLVFRQAERSVWSGGLLSHRLFMLADPAYRRAVRSIDQVMFHLIDERRRAAGRPGDLLDMLMEGCDPSDPQDRALLRDQLLSFLIAGHETTAVALTWTWHLLAGHPGVAARLHAEVDRVLGGRTPAFADLPHLRYTRMVFEEAMRLYPPVWTISREAIADDRIDGLTIPAGTTVMLCPYAVHRNPRLWPAPETFDPERFSDRAVAARPRYAYFPFGGGPRNCLGKRFGLMEGQIILAMVAQRFRVAAAPGQTAEPEPAITLRPRYGLKVILRDRRSDEAPSSEDSSPSSASPSARPWSNCSLARRA